MSVHGDHPTRYRFRVLQKLVLRARPVQVQALVLAQVEVAVVVVVVAEAAVQESALECAWEVREVALVPELAVLC